MDSAASQSPPLSEPAYVTDSDSKVAHGGVPPNLAPHHTTNMDKARHTTHILEEEAEEFSQNVATEVGHT